VTLAIGDGPAVIAERCARRWTTDEACDTAQRFRNKMVEIEGQCRVPMNIDRNNEIRRKSMHGTLLFALGILAVVAYVATGSVWLIGAAVIFLVPGVVMLHRVGKSLS
jgi:hypothetical protein